MRSAAVLLLVGFVATLAVTIALANPSPLRVDHRNVTWWAQRARLNGQRWRHERTLRRRLENRLEAKARERRLSMRNVDVRRDVDYALRLASAVTGVPLGELRAVAYCETGG